MAGRPSDADPTPTPDLFATMPEMNTQRLQSQDRLQNEFTPATALEFGLDLGFLDELGCNNDPNYMHSGIFYPLMIDENNPEAFLDPNDFYDDTSEEKSTKTEFDASAAQSEILSSPGIPSDLNDGAAAKQSLDMQQIQFASAQEPGPVSQEIVDPTQSFISAAEDFSRLFGISDSLGQDFNDPLPGEFELPENSSGLNFLQDLHLIGTNLQPAMSPNGGYSTRKLPHLTGDEAIQGNGSRRAAAGGPSTANRVALAGTSEPNHEIMSRTMLMNSRRLFNGHQRVATQRQPDVFRTRIHRNKRYTESSAYTPLAEAPKSWSMFEYTQNGELDPSRLFSADEINRFLFTHPLNQGHCNPKDSPLKLRVHKTPASSAKRFPNGLFCRFTECPMRTINQGQLLIVVDELSVQNPDHDLYLNAGYLHLWCMERYLDFPAICANLDVTAKGREARKEEGRKNRFTISGEEERVVEDFVACCTNGRRGVWVARCPDQQTNAIGCPHYEPQSLPYDGTLCHQLTITKLHHGGQGRINLRKGREEKAGYQGANITRHLGDLNKEVEMREYSRTHKNQNQLKPNPMTGRQYRTEVNEMTEDEQLGHGRPQINRQPTHQPPATVNPDQAYGTNRNSNERSDGQSLDYEIVQAHRKLRPRDFKIPVWNWNQSTKVGLGTEVAVGTPGISPRTTITPRPQQTRSQLHTTATNPPQDGPDGPDGPAAASGQGLSLSEELSEGEMELAMLAAQRRRRLLEIEDAKDKERECRLKKLKLQKAIEKKRAREERDDDDGNVTDSQAKRQRVR